MSIDMSGQSFLLDSTGNMFRIAPVRRLSSLDSALQAIGNSAGIKIRSAFHAGGKPVTACVKRDGVALGVEINEINLRTSFEVRDFDNPAGSGANIQKRLVPIFAGSGHSIQTVMKWSPPANMKLNFGIKTKFDETSKKHMVDAGVLFATAPTQGVGSGGTWLLPLSNMFEDGKICLGDGMFALRADNLPGILDKAIDLLQSSSWNADLRPRLENCWELFRFDPGTMSQIAPGHPEWWRWCRRVSNTLMGDITE